MARQTYRGVIDNIRGHEERESKCHICIKFYRLLLQSVSMKLAFRRRGDIEDEVDHGRW
jgi:hypothetical protein